MKVSREKVAENREKILRAAGRQFRERGFDAISVAEVMQAAGLTHGAFYGYFKSKEDLIAEVLRHLAEASPSHRETPEAYAARYLSPRHRADAAGGCFVAALGTELVRQQPETRASVAEAVRRHLARLSEGGGSHARTRAIGSYSAMVGALVLARISDDPALSDELLDETRAWIALHPDRGAEDVAPAQRDGSKGFERGGDNRT